MPVCLFYREAAHIMLLNIYYPAVSPDLFEAYLIAVDIAAKYAKENLNWNKVYYKRNAYRTNKIMNW